ncbi:MAG TPA: methyltransferase domain-containing protein [Patescibacteria group bacterium]
MKKSADGNSLIQKLQKEVEIFIETNPDIADFMWTSFVDHKNRYINDLSLINKYFKKGKSKKVMEIGSLPCHMTYCLKEMGFNTFGIDINPKVLSKFIRKCNLDVRKCDIEKQRLPFPDNYFDNILFNEVFEHLRIDPLSTLKEINRVMKPKGIMILTTPNLYALHKIIMFNTGKGFNNAYIEFEKLSKYGYMGHIREYSVNEVKNILEKSGFKVKKVEYKLYNYFHTNKLFSNPYKKVFAYLLDYAMGMVPRFRPGQIFIATK